MAELEEPGVLLGKHVEPGGKAKDDVHGDPADKVDVDEEEIVLPLVVLGQGHLDGVGEQLQIHHDNVGLEEGEVCAGESANE